MARPKSIADPLIREAAEWLFKQYPDSAFAASERLQEWQDHPSLQPITNRRIVLVEALEHEGYRPGDQKYAHLHRNRPDYYPAEDRVLMARAITNSRGGPYKKQIENEIIVLKRFATACEKELALSSRSNTDAEHVAQLQEKLELLDAAINTRAFHYVEDLNQHAPSPVMVMDKELLKAREEKRAQGEGRGR